MKTVEQTVDTLIDRIVKQRGARRKKHIVELKTEFQAIQLENERLKTNANTLQALLAQEREVIRMQRDTIKHIMSDKKIIEKQLLQLQKS